MSDVDASDLVEPFAAAVWALVRNYVIVEGTINAVYTNQQQDNNTADVAIDGAVFSKVPFKILTDGSPAADIELPKVGTDVLMGFRDGSLQRPQILLIQQGNQRFWTYDKVTFNGGQNGGLPLTPNLVSRLNLIENMLNQVIALYNGHTHNVTAVGAPTGPSLAPEENSLTPTQRGDIENTKILQ